MLSHDIIWTAIDRLASQKNLSPSGLARLAGLDSTSFNPSKRIKPNGRPRWPSTESIAKILSATQTSAGAFFDHEPVSRPRKKSNDAWLCCDIMAQSPAAHWPVWPCHIDTQPPVDSTAKTATHDQQHAPKPLPVSHAIVTLQVQGEQFLPLYPDGTHLLLTCHEALQRGNRVIVKCNPDSFLIGDIEQTAARSLRLRSLSQESEDMSVSLSCVEWVARILWASQ